MRTFVVALIAAIFAACSSSNPCSPDAGDDLKNCLPEIDGGSPDCVVGQACAPFTSTGGYRCVPHCNSEGKCAGPNTICAAVAVGQCGFDAGTDGGEPIQCHTEFLCYPNRCH